MSFKKLLNTFCDIQEAQKTQSASGQITDTFKTLHLNVPCRLRNRTADEKITSHTQYQTSTHALYTEHIKINPTTMRVLIKEEAYKIIGVIDMGGANKYLCLYLERYH